jgi:hypothetical protein
MREDGSGYVHQEIHCSTLEFRKIEHHSHKVIN